VARCAECGFDPAAKPLDEFAPEEVAEPPRGFCPRCGARLPAPTPAVAAEAAAPSAVAALDVPVIPDEELPVPAPEPPVSRVEPEDRSPEPPPAFSTAAPPTDLSEVRRDTERALADRAGRRAARRQSAVVIWVALIAVCCVVAFAGGAVLRNRGRAGRPASTAGGASAARTGAAGAASSPTSVPTTPTGSTASPVRGTQSGLMSGQPPSGRATSGPAAAGTGSTPKAVAPQRPLTYSVLNMEHLPAEAFGNKQAFVNWMVAHKHEDPKFLAQRWDRAQQCVHIGDMKQRRVLEAFLLTPREKFCRPWNLSRAYDHAYLDIHYGSTISGPNIMARMTDALNLKPSDHVLEIGTGSGYQSGILSNLCNHVYSIEIIAPLAKETRALYDKLIADGYKEYTNIQTKPGDGYYGWEEGAPFQGIVVTCSLDHEPPPLLRQLAIGGRMVIPIGPPGDQKVWCLTKVKTPDGKVKLERRDLYPNFGKKIDFLRFVDATGHAHGKAE